MLNVRISEGKLKLAISKNYSSSSFSGTVSAVKALKPFQSRCTSPGCYPSPPQCMPLPSHDRMAFSCLIKARERPQTRGGQRKKDANARKIKGQRTIKNRELRPENQRRKKTERTGESIRPRPKHTQTRRNKHGEKNQKTQRNIKQRETGNQGEQTDEPHQQQNHTGGEKPENTEEHKTEGDGKSRRTDRRTTPATKSKES